MIGSESDDEKVLLAGPALFAVFLAFVVLARVLGWF
jgi:hypothetical protein